MPRLSAISAPALTSNGRGLKPFWNSSSAEISNALPLPIKTDYVDLAGASLSTSLNSLPQNSWFSMKSHPLQNLSWSEISPRLSMYSPVESTDSVDTVTKSRKIRIYPTAPQKQLLRQWLGTARFAYNQSIAHLRQPDTKASWLTIKTPLISALPDWASKVPYQIKSIAIRDACLAVKAAKRKFQVIRRFQEVKFKSRKRRIDSVFIPKSALGPRGIYHTVLGSMKMTEALPHNPQDSRLKYEYGRWFLIVPHQVPKTPAENQSEIVALDPGVRTFQTWYSSNSYGKVGQSDFGKIHRLCYHLDDLMSRISRSQQKRRLIKAADKIRFRITNLISEIHHKTAKFLCQNFKTILIPKFESSKMVGKLSSRTARAMLTWSHFRFKEFLKHKAKELGSKVIEVSEAYTSKTCGQCGALNNIGSKTALICSCGLNIDRDLNGSRNILLRFLTEALLDKTCISSNANVAIS